MSDSKMLQVTERSRVKRQPKRGCNDLDTINQILDEALVVHVGFVVDNQPFVIPMGYGRDGEQLYLHGSTASRMLQNLEKGIEICVTATLLDGIVMARSLFHHSMNYRSAVLFGRATLVKDDAEKMHALKVLSEHMAPVAGNRPESLRLRKSKAPLCWHSPLKKAPPKSGGEPPWMMQKTTPCLSGLGNCP